MATEPMNHADAAWLHMDRRTNLMVINALMWFERPLDQEALEQVLRERLLARFPRFTQMVEEGLPGLGPHWATDPHFELRNHVHRIGLPAPGDRAALQALAGDLASVPLDRSRPLWSIHLIDNYGNGSALFVRMHHCIADGIALARVMLSLTDDDVGLIDANGNGDGSPIAALASIARAAAGVAAGAAAHPRAVAAQGLADARTLAKLLLGAPDPRGSLKGDLGVPYAMAWSPSFSLQRIREHAHEHGATVNDYLVAATAGALRRHVLAAGEAPRDLHALVPFNLRALDRPLPTSLGNRFGLVTLTLPVGVEDPVARLAAVRREMNAIKASHEPQISYGILDAIGRAPAALEARFVDFFSAHGTLVLTNVPGPERVVHLAGVPIQGVLVWAPTSGSLALSVSIFSYRGRVSVGFLADAGLVDDPESLVRDFHAELRALGRAVTAAA